MQNIKSINFKSLFTEKCPVIHNSDYFSNKHFLIKKSILKKSQLDYLNLFPLDTHLIQSLAKTIENESRKPIITEFIPQYIHSNNEYNTLIMEIDRGYKNCTDWLNKIYPSINESYYNLIQSLNCKLFIVNNDQVNPLSIYNSNNEFVGIVLPVKVKDCDIPNAKNYIDYLAELKLEQDAKELAKQNSKKCLYIKDNKAVVRNKELISIAELINDEAYKNLYIEKCVNENKNAGVYIDLGIVCVYIRTMANNTSTLTEDIKYYLSNLSNYTLEMALANIYNRKNNNHFINVADIKLVELSGATEQEVQGLIDYRQEWYDRKAKEEQFKKSKQEQEDKEYTDSKNKIVEDLILQAEQAIINNQKVNNKDITVYKSRYESNDTSLILHMMKLYEIKIPLKTQGWINQALAEIYYDVEDGKISYSYYKSSANSNVFRKYLNEFVGKVQDKYGVRVESVAK